MEQIQIIQVLQSTHTDFDRDYINSLIADHEGKNLFTRFVANVKLKRFFDYCSILRFRDDEREQYKKVAKSLESLIWADGKLLSTEQHFEDYRNLHLLPEFNPNATPGVATPIKFDEWQYSNLFGNRNYTHEFNLALKEYLRLDKEPYGVDPTKLVELHKEDLQEFQSRPKPIIQQQTPDNTPTKPQEPPKRIWKHQKQYLGYIVGKLIEGNYKIAVEPLSEVVANYFTLKDGKLLNPKTIRQNASKWKNRKDEIEKSKKEYGDSESFQMKETNRIEAEEGKHIQAVIDYFIKTR